MKLASSQNQSLHTKIRLRHASNLFYYGCIMQNIIQQPVVSVWINQVAYCISLLKLIWK